MQQKFGFSRLICSSRSETFRLARLKFYHAVTVLPQEVASQILDLICTPPARDPYKVLREGLIILYTLNDYQRFEALVSLFLFLSLEIRSPHI